MAEELQYSSDIGSNKRKYDEQDAPPPPRRPTGFSAPISSASQDDQAAISYNSVPPPSADDVDAQVQSAKQRAQEIASRLLYNAGLGPGAGTVAGVGGYEAKRVRVDNGGGFDLPIQDKAPINSAPSAIPVYNYPQNSSKKIDVPNGRVGVIIGKAGETIKSLQLQSGAKIQVTRDMDADRTSLTRPVELMGTPDQIARAEQLINDVLAEAESGGSGVAPRRTTSQPGSDQFVMRIPNNKVGLVIGKGGETIKSMQASTGARIQVVPLHPPPGDTSTERSVHIDGTPEQVEAAKQLVNEAISENRMRNSSMTGGGYNQQQYQARPQTSWGAAPQMQQAGGYGYVQPGAYPGAPQYASQAQYGGYPPQAAAAGGGYGANWDQTSAAQTAPQQGSSSGYDYYGQQQQQQAPSQQQPQNPSGQGDESGGGGGYNYNNTSQAPAASSYPHQGSYGYGGYGAQSGYYDQQQQGGYGSAAGYGGAQDGNGYGAAQGGDSTKASAAGYNSSGGQAAAAAAGYGVPAAPSLGGYGPPSTTQKPPAYGAAGGAYGQSQLSPTTASGSVGGGYGQAPPPGASYPHSQPPSTGGYAGAPAYGGPPPPAAPQSGYGHQVSPYGGGYGGSGYAPPPSAYYGGASATSAAPASQPSVAAAPKASPKS